MFPFLVDNDLNEQHVMVVEQVSIPTSCVSPANERTSETFAVQVVNQDKEVPDVLAIGKISVA